jgi:2-polyprenyl-3-methyl-5-hydroxy-6-metoxy-1,4-benzoquinol methylase
MTPASQAIAPAAQSTNPDPGFEGFRFDRTVEALIDTGAQLSRETVWLDLGCNQGQFLRRLVAKYQLRAIGCDDWPASQKSMEDAHWDYFQADLDRNLPWTGEADVVSALEVLEHMVDTDGFLARVLRVLRPGGYLLLSTPNINSLRNRITVPLGVYPTGLEYRTVIHHVRLYNPTVLRNHLHASGFTNIGIRGVSFLPMSSGLGTIAVSQQLAKLFPALCANIIAVAQRPR